MLGSTEIAEDEEFYDISEKALIVTGNFHNVEYKFRKINRYKIVGSEQNVENFQNLVKTNSKSKKKSVDTETGNY